MPLFDQDHEARMLLAAILAAVIPTIIYSLLIWWLDRYEKEPLALILAAFFWGAIPAIIIAVLFELVLSVPLELSPLGPNAANWGIAPLVEEVVKALALAALFFWAQNEFDGPLDGIVYGALIGFGFSMTENVLYFLAYRDLSELFWLRGVFFGLNHALFTSITGLALGLVRYQKSAAVRVWYALGGLLLAILFHATHNYLTSSFQTAGLVYSWLVQSSGVLVVLAIAVLAWRNELRWLRSELDGEVHAGVIAPEDYAIITLSAGRMQREFAALVHHGPKQFLQMRRLHYAITELAFCKSRQRLADRSPECPDTERLRREILTLRQAVTETKLNLRASD